jgi:nanoRNase/pAp phosphatase (c-di-AMP/oligoRNAs hydrolase)
MRGIRKSTERLPKLLSALGDGRTLLIVMQDNPDPDAIASATALRELANTLKGIACTLTHGGTIGRAENRELVRYLGIRPRLYEDVRGEAFDAVALVDTQPGTGNNPLEANVLPQVVIDHHPVRRATRRVPCTDVRSRYGATSTILWEYLVVGGVPLTIPLATALLYGITSDTQELGRECTKADVRALNALYPLANKRMLNQIRRGSVPDEYYQMLLDGLQNAMTYGPCTMTGLGDVANPDMIGEVADLLLRHERALWTVCYGYYGGRLLFSVRTDATDQRADEVARRIAYRMGTAGGHAAMAGGQIALGEGNGKRRLRLERAIRDRLLRAIRVADATGERLVARRG